jgi:hypothetical protein
MDTNDFYQLDYHDTIRAGDYFRSGNQQIGSVIIEGNRNIGSSATSDAFFPRWRVFRLKEQHVPRKLNGNRFLSMPLPLP